MYSPAKAVDCRFDRPAHEMASSSCTSDVDVHVHTGTGFLSGCIIACEGLGCKLPKLPT